MTFQEINIRELPSPVKLISDDWTLVTAGQEGNYNTMTASWGTLGKLWQKDVAIVFVRPQRHTFGFMESNDYYTLSFFGGAFKKELAICGSKSGRDIDKAKETGLTPVFDGEVTYFEQAERVLVCRKMAFQDLNPNGFLDPAIFDLYEGDYHRMYVGEVVKVLQKVN